MTHEALDGGAHCRGSYLGRTGVVAVPGLLLGPLEKREGACCLERRLSSLSTCFITFSVSFMRACIPKPPTQPLLLRRSQQRKVVLIACMSAFISASACRAKTVMIQQAFTSAIMSPPPCVIDQSRVKHKPESKACARCATAYVVETCMQLVYGALIGKACLEFVLPIAEALVQGLQLGVRVHASSSSLLLLHLPDKRQVIIKQAPLTLELFLHTQRPLIAH